ncbi:hypothetical protein ABZ234_08015 [Nocardiopsis sp. NPDC006198]|uniref:hypothetical protein n=1 Tax=Nocardiopsis sp. NPDC006198 TaxID=3154472 RepID=UPI0033B128F4
MLARILAKTTPHGADTAAAMYQRTYGAKYGQTNGLSAAGIAALVRADIRLALKVAKAFPAPGAVAVADPFATFPKGLKITVRKDTFSGGRSIDIIVRNIPAEWGWTQETDPWGDPREVPTPALSALARELKAILQAYNYDGSDRLTDYYDVNFYGHVTTECGLTLA